MIAAPAHAIELTASQAARNGESLLLAETGSDLEQHLEIAGFDEIRNDCLVAGQRRLRAARQNDKRNTRKAMIPLHQVNEFDTRHYRHLQIENDERRLRIG